MYVNLLYLEVLTAEENQAPASSVAQTETRHLNAVAAVDGEQIGTHGLTGTVQAVKVVGILTHTSLVQTVDG